MRVALISTVSSPVRLDSQGSVEALIFLLAHELKQLGHDITVFACEGSKVDGNLVTTLPGPYATAGSLSDWHLCEWINLCHAVEQAGNFDILHSHAYLWGIPLQRICKTPMVHTIHIVPDNDHAQLWSMSGHAWVTAITRHQWELFPQLKPVAVVPHGVDPTQFTFQPVARDYLCFIGRFTEAKGPVQAIKTAKALGKKIILAGPTNEYYLEHVKPLVNDVTVVYMGWAGLTERNELLGGAQVMIYPITYPEAFGLVLVEAMLCGTPVAAMRLGAVAEIVDEGITGYCADSPDGLIEAVLRAKDLDRRRVRKKAAERFSPQKMARGYARVYEQITSAT
jgi:glycosyltransferase involved in cell wall biosynthesis